MRRTILLFIFSLSIIKVASQTGGDNVYEFLNLSPGAYLASLGGYNVSLFSNDPSLTMLNPALAGMQNNNNLALNYTNYFAGINYGSIMYSRHADSLGSFSAGINYLNYGKFDRADASGIRSGSFSASEYAFNIIYTRNIDSLINLGINFKPVISQLEKYISVGLALDIGASWKSKNELYSAGLSIRNIGLQLTTYSGVREKLPFEIIAGASARLKHAPFRFSITARHLEKYDLLYEYTEKEDKEYSGISEIAENMMRHLIFGIEIIPSENFFISAGLNYQRRKELLFDLKSSTVGFSLGAGIKTSNFDISLSRSRFHLAGSCTGFTVILKPALFSKFK